MGQVWSSLWDVQLPFNCYETAHTWTPMCHRAWMDLFKDVMTSTLPLHLFFYSVWLVPLRSGGGGLLWRSGQQGWLCRPTEEKLASIIDLYKRAYTVGDRIE